MFLHADNSDSDQTCGCAGYKPEGTFSHFVAHFISSPEPKAEGEVL